MPYSMYALLRKRTSATTIGSFPPIEVLRAYYAPNTYGTAK
jgi:hypothetical protein